MGRLYYESDSKVESNMLFENLPDLITLNQASKVLNKKVKTFYDWKYRGKTRKDKIPSNLFVKLSGNLYLRKKVLESWAFNQTSSN